MKKLTNKIFSTLLKSILLVLPTQIISRSGRFLFHCRVVWLKRILINLFQRRYKLDMSEAVESDLENYKTLSELFSRPLKPGKRTILADKEVLISPTDGTIIQYGQLTSISESLIQAKRFKYSLNQLLADSDLSNRFRNSQYLSIYLAPWNYHRIHAPYDAEIIEVRSIPGRALPVNRVTREHYPQLYTKNARKILLIKTEAGGEATEIIIVLIGALFVQDIHIHAENNKLAPSRVSNYWEKGRELGYFAFGSSAVLIFRRPFQMLSGIMSNKEVKVGQALARFDIPEKD